jgi:ubiquinone biosynthesis monooxygenase Coq7
MATAPSPIDVLLGALDQALRVMATRPTAARPLPGTQAPDAHLSAADRAHSAALMRVNHAGEVAAQALYLGQAVLARSVATRRHLLAAADEERDHLAWCHERLQALGQRRSLLTPFWFAGAFTIGLVAGGVDDRYSLGFVAETERQVEAHLKDHLERLPPEDRRSRAILEQMASDEVGHGTAAERAGGRMLPPGARRLMALGGEILRTVASRV